MKSLLQELQDSPPLHVDDGEDDEEEGRGDGGSHNRGGEVSVAIGAAAAATAAAGERLRVVGEDVGRRGCNEKLKDNCKGH